MDSKCLVLVGLLVFALCPNCSDKPADTRAVKREMMSRELKRVSEADISRVASGISEAFFAAGAEEKLSLSDSLGLIFMMVDAESDPNLANLMEAYAHAMRMGHRMDDYREKKGKFMHIYRPAVANDSLAGLHKLIIPIKSIVDAL